MRKIIGHPCDDEKVLVLARPTAVSCVHALDGIRLELPHRREAWRASPGGSRISNR